MGFKRRISYHLRKEREFIEVAKRNMATAEAHSNKVLDIRSECLHEHAELAHWEITDVPSRSAYKREKCTECGHMWSTSTRYG